MGALRYILNNLLLFELCTGRDENSISIWKVSAKRNGVSLTKQTFHNLNNMDKWKHCAAVLLVTGEQVVEKKLRSTDAFIQKITENPELLWNLHSQIDSEEQTISFLRKELTEELVESLKKHNIYVFEKWISKNENPDREQMVADFYKKQINLSDIRKDPVQTNLLSLVIYYKIRLPILLLFFVILLGNFLLNARVRQEYEIVQSELYLNQRKNKQQQNNQKKQGRIQSQYQSIPNRSLALIADRIASYVPPKLILNSLILSPLEGIDKNFVSRNKEYKYNKNLISIKGETEIPGEVSLFTQYLDKDQLFSGVKIHSLTREKDSFLFTFELNVELKP